MNVCKWIGIKYKCSKLICQIRSIIYVGAFNSERTYYVRLMRGKSSTKYKHSVLIELLLSTLIWLWLILYIYAENDVFFKDNLIILEDLIARARLFVIAPPTKFHSVNLFRLSGYCTLHGAWWYITVFFHQYNTSFRYVLEQSVFFEKYITHFNEQFGRNIAWWPDPFVHKKKIIIFHLYLWRY